MRIDTIQFCVKCLLEHILETRVYWNRSDVESDLIMHNH